MGYTYWLLAIAIGLAVTILTRDFLVKDKFLRKVLNKLFFGLCFAGIGVCIIQIATSF